MSGRNTPMTSYFSLPMVPVVAGYDARLQFIHEDDGLRAIHEAAIADVPGKSAGLFDQELGDGFSLQKLLEDVHRKYLERAMEEAGGVKTKAAELLGMSSYQTLDAQLKRLKVKVGG